MKNPVSLIGVIASQSDTAMPFPYFKIIVASCGAERHRDGWEDTAVPFPYPNYIVGKRHCRVLTVGNLL